MHDSPSSSNRRVLHGIMVELVEESRDIVGETVFYSPHR
jgi:hypothetical protein